MSTLLYLSSKQIVDQENLEAVEEIKGAVVFCVAAWFGKVRLIDNMEINVWFCVFSLYLARLCKLRVLPQPASHCYLAIWVAKQIMFWTNKHGIVPTPDNYLTQELNKSCLAHCPQVRSFILLAFHESSSLICSWMMYWNLVFRMFRNTRKHLLCYTRS